VPRLEHTDAQWSARGILTAIEQDDSTKAMLGMSYVLNLVTSTASAPANTAENSLASVTVPGGIMGATGALRVTFDFVVTDNANAKTLRLKLGTSTLRTYNLAAGVSRVRDVLIVFNRAWNAQLVIGAAPFSGIESPALYGENSNSNLTLQVTAQKAVATDVVSRQFWLVELFPTL
jgi:hypothetical protein